MNCLLLCSLWNFHNVALIKGILFNAALSNRIHHCLPRFLKLSVPADLPQPLQPDRINKDSACSQVEKVRYSRVQVLPVESCHWLAIISTEPITSAGESLFGPHWSMYSSSSPRASNISVTLYGYSSCISQWADLQSPASPCGLTIDTGIKKWSTRLELNTAIQMYCTTRLAPNDVAVLTWKSIDIAEPRSGNK